MKRYIKCAVQHFRLTEHKNQKLSTTLSQARRVAQSYIDEGYAAACYCITCNGRDSTSKLGRKFPDSNFELLIDTKAPLILAETIEDYRKKVKEFCGNVPERYFTFKTIYNRNLEYSKYSQVQIELKDAFNSVLKEYDLSDEVYVRIAGDRYAYVVAEVDRDYRDSFTVYISDYVSFDKYVTLFTVDHIDSSVDVDTEVARFREWCECVIDTYFSESNTQN